MGGYETIRRQPHASTHLWSHYSITINNRTANRSSALLPQLLGTLFRSRPDQHLFNAIARGLLSSCCRLRRNNGCRRHRHRRRRDSSLRKMHTSNLRRFYYYSRTLPPRTYLYLCELSRPVSFHDQKRLNLIGCLFRHFIANEMFFSDYHKSRQY